MRYAVYAVPGTRPGDAVGADLAARAEAWLGRSAAGRDVTPVEFPGLPRRRIDEFTRSARRYGFHGTLKAPFRLAPGREGDELEAGVADLAAARDAVAVPALGLSRIGPFLALTPGAPAPALDALAADVVTRLDGLRAPATAADIARRDPDSLTPRQRDLLHEWGYPYVLDEFRFHLTLTDPLPYEVRPGIESALRSHVHDLLGADIPLDALAVFVEPAPGEPFTVRSIHPLRPASGGSR